ncbi:Serine protease nudel [Ooceraea biroi]|uniref:Serine protease nudel n=1 Tax=Ooceraea biroi TaxID=2015173 RepID=A0A026W3L5_OOCBI|nr:Serine protease nudel [Ooceraea biroi]
MIKHDCNSNITVDIQPESHEERVIRLSYPLGERSLSGLETEGMIDEDSSFNDQLLRASQITRSANDDAFPTINEPGVATRSKRTIPRKRRECKLNEEHCKTLLKSMKSYFEALSETRSGKGTYTYEDIVKCIQCKNLVADVTNEISKETMSRPHDRYYPYGYVKQNHSSDLDMPIVKLLDDEKLDSSTKCTDDQTETSKMQPMKTGFTKDISQSTVEISLSSISSETTTISITTPDRVSPWASPQVNINVTGIANVSRTNISDTQSTNNSIASKYSQKVKIQKTPSIESVFTKSNVDVTAESKSATDSAQLQFITTESSSSTQNSIIRKDNAISENTMVVTELSETKTRNHDVANQIAITENVTSVSEGYDVTGITGDTVHPSTHPSLEGHPEVQLAAPANGARSMDGYYPINNAILLNHLQTTKKNKNNQQAIAENTKSFQELQLTPTWTTHPVCFFGYPGQLSNKPLPAGFTPYMPPFVPSAQDQGFPSQTSFRHTAPQPNYMQVQAQTVQFLPRNDARNRMQTQPIAQGVGPTGPAMLNAPIFPMNQQPISTPQHSPEMFQQSGTDVPYFCTNMPIPTYNFPLIPSTSHSSRSSNVDEAEPADSRNNSRKHITPTLTPKDNSSPQHNYYPWKYFMPTGCPEDYRQCNDQFCIPQLKWCDGHVDCADASDETQCSCNDRIWQNRLCDGYPDCPDGEDELNCFDCPADFFNCDDWRRPDNCVPLKQRCDGIEQCLNGKDEHDCNILSSIKISENDIFAVGYAEGFLHKNIEGRWYPVCSNTSYWAVDACMSEIGQPLTMPPQMSFVQVPTDVFQDSYVAEFNGQIKIVSCSGMAVFVKCPQLSCGTRSQDISIASNENGNPYTYRKRSGRQNTQFHKVYQETLDLLKQSRAMSDEDQDNDDALIGSPRVVGGRMSQPKSWPFLVAIYKDGLFHCGGVILNELYILTAGHCMTEYEKHYYEVEAGVLRRYSFSPMVQLRKAMFVIVHPNYDITLFHNDVALIVLDKPLLFNRWVRPICLPTVNTAGPEWEQGPTPQSICVAVGWGAVREFGPDPDHLQEVAVPILSSCKHLADQINSTICAGYVEGGHDACQGDSGGPLLCRNPQLESQWYVAGIISHGDGCGRPNEPGVYTKVSYFVNWIQEVFELRKSASLYSYAHLQSLNKCTGFSCLSGSQRCLSITKHCDGIVDCMHGEDEINCLQISGYYRSNTNNETAVLNFKTKVTDETPNNYMKNQMLDDDENSSITTSDVTFKSTTDSIRLTFTCKRRVVRNVAIRCTVCVISDELNLDEEVNAGLIYRLIQTITIDKRCDRHLDCEDGSDEEDCTCRDYLLNTLPSAICDGYLDCKDETDEKDCGTCKGKFHCKSSRKCIPMAKRCDANYDCFLKEDETDCLALTDGEYVDLDSDNRTFLRQEGFLSRRYGEGWRIQCLQPEILENDTIKSTVGENVCVYLGFANLQSVEKVVMTNAMLETRSWQWRNNTIGYRPSPSHVAGNEEVETCGTLWIRCRPVLSSSADTHLVVDPRTGSYNYLWPWMAAIFVDGRYHCSAVLLEPDWLLSSASCTDDIKLSVNYTTALLGRSRSYLYVDGPHQQISVINEIRNVSKSNLSLFHLKTAVNFTRYVQPLFLEKKIYPPAESNFCVAVATNKQHVTHSIILQPVLANCDKCSRCFTVSRHFTCPINGTSSDWSGTVFCHNEHGWYPAAAFQEEALCSSGKPRNWTSIDYIHAYLTQALEEKLYPTPEPTCNGVRCNIGQCIPWSRVCDGMTECRDGADEAIETCSNKHKMRSKKIADECTVSQLRCESGECVSKSSFCDGKVDCSDGTDEPVMCTCAEYLRLTAPKRLCDGVWHCLDKSDESPEECNCTETSFKCNAKENNSTCLPQDFVCDGNNDCPDGEDEKECIKVKESANDNPGTGEVMQRSYGVWHSHCFSAPVTKTEEARTICQTIGYTDGSILHDNRTVSEPLIPFRDDFYMVRINRALWVTMRTDKPLINLIRPKEVCHRLFVSCS